MLDRGQEGAMRRRLEVPMVLLFLLMTAVLLPAVPSAEAEPATSDWASRLQAMDEAIAHGDLSGAQAAWREAYAAAHVGRGWPGMIAVGEAALRLGRATGDVSIAESRARRVYLTALLRARRQGSLDGVLASGDAFGRLGDREVVRQALTVATDLAARSGDDVARRRVQAFRSHWMSAPLT
jgi:hypothetical protein